MEKNSPGSVGVTWLITFGEDKIYHGYWERQHRNNKVQDSQCTYRRVRATIVVVEMQEVLYILSVCEGLFRYPACNAHAPYYNLWPASLYKVYPHYLINGTVFEKKSY